MEFFVIILAILIYSSQGVNRGRRQSSWEWGNDEDQPFESEENECLNQCRIPSKYKPVCGTDDISYYNVESLQCSKKCGEDVDVAYNGRCQKYTTPPIVSTTTIKPTTDFLTYWKCTRTCGITSQYNPVCGTDHVTYENIQALRCAQSCGRDVELLFPANCVRKEIKTRR